MWRCSRPQVFVPIRALTLSHATPIDEQRWLGNEVLACRDLPGLGLNQELRQALADG